ncbi:MAG TPA: hypothetical protein VFB62_27905 [Polyangiaceae bacterium]|nr:hypothetical protein [Polyangiaceae bacterium]
MQRLWMALLMATLTAIGCSPEPEENDDDDGGDSSGSTSGNTTSGSGMMTEEYLCCLNGSFFDCPDESALLRCGNDFDPAECTRDESRDDECAAL